MHRECMNYLDEYKACLIGMNQQSIGGEFRTVLSEQQLYDKRHSSRETKATHAEDKAASTKGGKADQTRLKL